MSETIARLQNTLKIIDSSKLFQGTVIAVIVISALLIGAKTHDLPEPLVDFLGILDVTVTIFFAVEIVIRYLATERKSEFFKKGWNIFDTIIVIGSLIPDGGSGVLLARLLRVFRVLRLVSMVPELRMLINALIKAIPQMTYIALLMFVIFYIYAAIGSIIFHDINEFLWGDVSVALLTLFRVATFEDWTDVMYETMAVYPLSWIFYLTFIFLTAFIFLNMMVGTVLEVMSAEHELQRASSHGETAEGGEPASRAQVDALQEQLTHLQQLLEQQQNAKR
ncbi:ion transporter [Thalassotalea mangrovi]|uniref:Ion transporter n=1 Tax=Thalassotalea mangrovi TaxID=2572245 RepID=A0A4V5NU67_9GAMM|nr:ion transporter [Thalassotalea mangrovi]TKB45065.1 ion transporter [Thalassotalea mangrovi]